MTPWIAHCARLRGSSTNRTGGLLAKRDNHRHRYPQRVKNARAIGGGAHVDPKLGNELGAKLLPLHWVFWVEGLDVVLDGGDTDKGPGG